MLHHQRKRAAADQDQERPAALDSRLPVMQEQKEQSRIMITGGRNRDLHLILENIQENMPLRVGELDISMIQFILIQILESRCLNRRIKKCITNQEH